MTARLFIPWAAANVDVANDNKLSLLMLCVCFFFDAKDLDTHYLRCISVCPSVALVVWWFAYCIYIYIYYIYSFIYIYSVIKIHINWSSRAKVL